MPIYRVFHDAGAAGNLCRVDQSPAGARREPALTHCRTRSSGIGRVDAECVTAAGQPIACCGHGLLACAHYWYEQGWRGPLRLGGVRSRRERGLVWLDFPRLPCAPAALPAWAGAMFSSPPRWAAVAGGATGYLILEWPPGFALCALLPPGSGLAAHTARAIIACAGGARSSVCELRYFAPQYGVDEDAATGSAVRVLADYWQRRHGCGRLDVRQRSPAGGRLYGRARGARVEVGGRVERLRTGQGQGEPG